MIEDPLEELKCRSLDIALRIFFMSWRHPTSNNKEDSWVEGSVCHTWGAHELSSNFIRGKYIAYKSFLNSKEDPNNQWGALHMIIKDRGDFILGLTSLKEENDAFCRINLQTQERRELLKTLLYISSWLDIAFRTRSEIINKKKMGNSRSIPDWRKHNRVARPSSQAWHTELPYKDSIEEGKEGTHDSNHSCF